MHRGYAKLWRKSVESELWGDWKAWGVWNWCLIRATHRENTVYGRTLEPGQFVTGRNEGSRECKMAPSTWQDCMNRCQKAGYITMATDTRGTVVTIVAYHVYNDTDDEDRHVPVGSPLPARGVPVGSPTQGTDTKENNSTRTQEHKRETPLPPLPAILDTEEFRAVLTDWLAYHKPYKPQGLTAMVTRAAWRATRHGVDAVLSAFVQAMGNGWVGWDVDSSFPKPDGRNGQAAQLFQEYATDEP